MTTKDMRDLLVAFLDVKNKGWIKTMRKGSTGIGYTFESMLGKPEEQFPIPDFNNIEIKVKKKHGYGNITLFNATPDNEVFAINRIYKEYSIQNKNMNYLRTFMININTINYKKYGKHLFNLKVDYINKIIKLCIYDLNCNLIENNISWSFELIEEKIRQKIQNIAIVKAEEKNINDERYFRYYTINFYEIKSIKTFIELVNKGIISITFKIGVYCTGKKTGEMNNHGVGFIIHQQNINQLYNKKEFKKND